VLTNVLNVKKSDTSDFIGIAQYQIGIKIDRLGRFERALK